MARSPIRHEYASSLSGSLSQYHVIFMKPLTPYGFLSVVGEAELIDGEGKPKILGRKGIFDLENRIMNSSWKEERFFFNHIYLTTRKGKLSLFSHVQREENVTFILKDFHCSRRESKGETVVAVNIHPCICVHMHSGKHR